MVVVVVEEEVSPAEVSVVVVVVVVGLGITPRPSAKPSMAVTTVAMPGTSGSVTSLDAPTSSLTSAAIRSLVPVIFFTSENSGAATAAPSPTIHTVFGERRSISYASRLEPSAVAKRRGASRPTASRAAIATLSRSEADTTTTSWAQMKAPWEMLTDAASTLEPVIRSALGPLAEEGGTSGMDALHGLRSSVVSVVEPLAFVPPVVVSPPVVDGPVPADAHAAATRVNAAMIRVRRNVILRVRREATRRPGSCGAMDGWRGRGSDLWRVVPHVHRHPDEEL